MPDYTYSRIPDNIFQHHYLISAYPPFRKWRVQRSVNLLLIMQLGFLAVTMAIPKSAAINSPTWLTNAVSELSASSASNADTSDSSTQIIYASYASVASVPTRATPAPLVPPAVAATPAPIKKAPPKLTAVPAIVNNTLRPLLRFGLIAPLEETGINQLFKPGIHEGVDFRAPMGTPVNAAGDGVVTEAKTSGWNGGYGKTILIDHGNGLSTRYAHLSRLLVSEGEHVKKGQIIAYSGTTGNSTGPHLHFEIRLNNIPQNPLP